jgi:hypothetical protein
MDEILDAFQILLEKSTGFATSRVIEWYGDTRPSAEAGDDVVWFRWLDEDPDSDSGAGRHGFKVSTMIEVNLVTRNMGDQNQRSKRIGRAHLANRYKLLNGIQGRFLFDSYEDRIDEEPPKPSGTALPLSISTMVIDKLPKTDRDRPESGYLVSKFGVRFDIVFRLTLNDAPPLGVRKFAKDA